MGWLVLERTPPNTESFFIKLVHMGQALQGLKPAAMEVRENTPLVSMIPSQMGTE